MLPWHLCLARQASHYYGGSYHLYCPDPSHPVLQMLGRHASQGLQKEMSEGKCFQITGVQIYNDEEPANDTSSRSQSLWSWGLHSCEFGDAGGRCSGLFRRSCGTCCSWHTWRRSKFARRKRERPRTSLIHCRVWHCRAENLATVVEPLRSLACEQSFSTMLHSFLMWAKRSS